MWHESIEYAINAPDGNTGWRKICITTCMSVVLSGENAIKYMLLVVGFFFGTGYLFSLGLTRKLSSIRNFLVHKVVWMQMISFFVGVFIHLMKDGNYGNECVQNHVVVQTLHHLQWSRVVKFERSRIPYTRRGR